MTFRKKPVVIVAHQWNRNGEHPDDFSDRDNGEGVHRREGMVVRYFRRSEVPRLKACKNCGRIMDEHGWIVTLEGGHIVCPGDWIITGVSGERYPCKPDIFKQTYELVE